MEFLKKNFWFCVLLFMVVTNIFLWYVLWHELPGDTLKVVFLNVGQGDAIYIESPHHNQILIDGGPPRKILAELGAVMPLYDRSLDMIIVTNPDQDHIGGFIDVLSSYDVKSVVEPGTKSETDTYNVLKNSIINEKSGKHIARSGMIIKLGGGAYLHILYPDQDVSGLSTNDGSIIAKLTYGSTSVMFTGDAPSKIEEYAISASRDFAKSTILKVGHHGSRTSASEKFVLAVDPDYAVISAGVKNKYGHPHKETLELFKKLAIPILGTYEKGRIVFTSDGQNFTRVEERFKLPLPF